MWKNLADSGFEPAANGWETMKVFGVKGWIVEDSHTPLGINLCWTKKIGLIVKLQFSEQH